MRIRDVAALTLAVVAAACSRSAPPAAPDVLPTIPYEKYTLPNGLDVILSEDHRLPLVAIDIWYHVGPANEVAGRTGFAHLFEHMMFQGSKHVPGDSHFKLLEAAGGTDSNGTTGLDRTNYFETLPSNQLELGLWLESDRMGYLLDTVDEAKLANQQDVVRNERRESIENRPYGIVNEGLQHALYPQGHPYYANVMGSHADIQAAKLADVKAFFKQYYAPNNASLAIVGDFDQAGTKALVEKYFGPLKRGADVPKATVTQPVITAERRVVIKDRIRLPRVYMAWHTPAMFKPGDADADAASAVLGDGQSSRLYKKLVYEKQIAQDVQAYQQSNALSSVFEIAATVRPDHTPEEVEAAINEELNAFRQSGPTQTELQRAQNKFETGFLEGLETLGGYGGVADTLNMFNHHLGDPGYLPKYIDEHRKVTPASVKAFAEQYLQPNARVVVHAVTGQPDFGPAVPTPPAPKAARGTGAESINADAAWRDEQPKPSAAKAVTLPPAASFTLANGLTVIHQVREGMPVVSASIVLKSGGDANPVTRSGLANFTAAMLDQGTSSRDALKIADDVALLGASLNATSSKDSIAVTSTSLRKNFAATLDILADVVLHPSFPETEIGRQRSSQLSNLMAASQDPGNVASIAAVNALYGPVHPYGYIELGLPAGVNATTRDDLMNYWKKNFVPSNAALVVAGPIDEATLKPLVEKAFGPWPAAQAQPPVLGKPRTTDARVILLDAPGAPQTQLMVTSIGAARSTPDFPALQVMNSVLGGLFSSRINLNLREAHGYSYGTFSQFLFRKSPGPFWVTGAVRTDATAPAVTEILKELKRIGEAPVSADELAMAKDSIVRSIPGAFETGATTVGSLSNIFVFDLGLDYFAKYPASITAVTAANAQDVAKKYLDPAKMLVVAVGDRSKIESGLKALNLGKIELRSGQ